MTAVYLNSLQGGNLCTKSPTKKATRVRSLVIFLLFLIVDLEVAKLIGLLVACDDTKPVPEVVLLQVLLCHVLEVPVQGQALNVTDLIICVINKS